MAKRWFNLFPIIVLGLHLASCNRPQISVDAALPDEEDLVPCNFQALREAFENEAEITLSPGCVYHAQPKPYSPGTQTWCGAAFPPITSSKTIHGNGATITPDPETLILHFFWVWESGELKIDNLRFENGDTIGDTYESWQTEQDYCYHGGAIRSDGNLIISDSQFIGNRAVSGGAIAATSNGSLEIINTLFEGNIATQNGGAIGSGASTVIADSVFRNNQAEDGGAIAGPGIFEISRTTFDGNNALEIGGAIYNRGYVEIERSSLIHNFAGRAGGAIFNSDDLVVTNSTISTNQAPTAGGVFSSASFQGSYVSIINNQGGGVHAPQGFSAGAFRNSIIANNTGSDCTGIVDVEEGTNNLDTDGTCDGFSLTGDPFVGPLANNGGPTLTHALPGNSPAIDIAVGECPDTDQIGVSRPEGDACDLGAYEYGLQVIGGLPPFLPGEAGVLPEIQELLADPLLPDGNDEPKKPSHTGRIEYAVPCFNGPGPMYAVVSSLQPGALVEIIGISQNGDYIVILNPCYPGVPCWTEEGSIEIHDQLDPSRVIPDPALPEKDEEDTSGDGLVCSNDLESPDCEAAGGWMKTVTYPPECVCP